MEMCVAVDEAARRTAGKKSIAMEAYATALRQIPMILCDNGGFDATELVSQLRSVNCLLSLTIIVNIHLELLILLEILLQV